MEIEQRLDDPVIPKVMSRLDENGNMQSALLQDMFPFLEEEEYSSMMINEKPDTNRKSK